MRIKGKYFPSQESSEKIFLLIRRHWIIFFAIFLFIFILLVPVAILLIYWLSNSDIFSDLLGNFVIIFGSIYTLSVLGLSLYGFVNYYLDVYIVTNRRIVDIKQNGFFRRNIAELHLHQVQDVEAKVEGFFQTLFHFGNIYIQTAGERENFVFEDVPHPYTLTKKIVELHEAQIESEYEPKKHLGRDQEIDDYRPEDYHEEITEEKSVSYGDDKFMTEASQITPKKIDTKEAGNIKVDKPKIAADDQEKKDELAPKELIEGKEISLDDFFGKV